MESTDSNTEERILEAAKTAFMKYGLYGARMQDIADNAGINKALLHYYFRSKEKLFDTVFEGALSRYFDNTQVLADTSMPLQERLFRYVDNVIDFFSEYPQMSMFIIKEVSVNPEIFHEKILALKKGPKVRLITLIQDAIKRGEVKEIDPVIFTMNLHSLCAYPFLASPIFKAMANGCDVEWTDPNERLKASVKEFIAFRLTK
jgi:AcrR family transcriptional regulator